MEKISIISTPIEFDKSDFLSLLSLSAGSAILRQNRMGKLVIGENGWNVDLKNRTIKFGANEFECGIIGSEDFYSQTWLWGWANTESGLPEISFAPARRVKRNLPDCAEITTGKFSLDELHSGHNLAMVTVGAAEKNACYYRCPYEGGAVFVQINGLPEEIFAPASLLDIANQIVGIIGSLYCDHRLLCAGMLHQNGYRFEASETGFSATDGTGTLRVQLENVGGLNRIVGINLDSAK